MDVSRDTETARQQLDARLTTLRHELEHHEVGPAVIRAISERVAEPTHAAGEARRTVVAADDAVVFDDVRAGHTSWPEGTTTGPLPDLSGWLHQAADDVPFVLVVADREGADVDLYRAGSAAPEHREVHGTTLHITKVPQGDWAQKEFQQRAENTWRHNAEQVAETISSLQKQYQPHVVVLAGEDRARAEVGRALEAAHVGFDQVESGGRAAGASEEALWRDVERVLTAYQATSQKEVAEQLLEGSGQGRAVARGLDDVLDALVQAKVERLVLDLPATRELTVRPGDHLGLPLPEAAAASDELRADLVLVAAGAATDARLSLVPSQESMGAGVAALLRWDSAAQ
jgi:hypothetical protein